MARQQDVDKSSDRHGKAEFQQAGEDGAAEIQDEEGAMRPVVGKEILKHGLAFELRRAQLTDASTRRSALWIWITPPGPSVSRMLAPDPETSRRVNHAAHAGPLRLEACAHKLLPIYPRFSQPTRGGEVRCVGRVAQRESTPLTWEGFTGSIPVVPTT